jgi:DNA polymerase-3 subunit delta
MIVFLETNLNLNNPIVEEIKKCAQVKQFRPLFGEDLRRWINNRVSELGSRITPDATKKLVEFIGPDLWMMENELQKLTLYAGAGHINEETINLLVPRLKEANIFKTVDAILEGRSFESIQSARKLSEDGAHISYILTMIARQLRLILLAKSLIKNNVTGNSLSQRLGLRAEFAVERTVAQARRYDVESLTLAYRKLLDADLAVKTSSLSDEFVIETTIADMIQKVSKLKAKVSRTGSH